MRAGPDNAKTVPLARSRPAPLRAPQASSRRNLSMALHSNGRNRRLNTQKKPILRQNRVSEFVNLWLVIRLMRPPAHFHLPHLLATLLVVAGGSLHAEDFQGSTHALPYEEKL